MRLEPRDTAGKPPPSVRDNAADKAGFLRKNGGQIPGPARPALNRPGIEHAGAGPGGFGPAESDPVEFAQSRLSGTGKSVSNPQEGAPPSQSRRIMPGTEVFTRLAASLGIPADSLQAAILSFSRYFSLPLEPGLLLKLRREVLSLKTPGEAGALGAAAAADKGVELSPRGLEDYTAAIEGFVRDQGDAGGNSRGDAEEEDERRNRASPEGEYPGKGVPEPELPEGGALRERALREEEHLPLLGLLNRLPGREGRRWMVFPFTWSPGGVAFRISLRLLFNNDGYDDHRVLRLALDIRNERRRWSFTLDKPGEADAETRVSLSPPLPEAAAETLRAELQDLLGPLGGSLEIAGESSLFGDSKNDALLSVNEEV